MSRASAVLVAAVTGVCIAFLPITDATFDRYELPKEAVLAAMALAAAGGLSRPRGGADTVDALAFLVAAVSAASAALARAPVLAIRLLGLTLATGVLFVTARRLDDAGRRLVLSAIAASACAVSVVALAESFGLLTSLSRTGRAPGATLGQRNTVAHLVVLASPAAWALAASAPSRRARAAWLAVAATLAAALVQTRSRAGWLVAPAVLGAWMLFAWRPRGARVVGIAAAVALGAALSAVIPSRLVWRSKAPLRETLTHLVESDTGSGKGRLVQARASVRLLSDAPILGVGPGHWMSEYPRVRPKGDVTFDPEQALPTGRLPNSDLLAWVVERGFAGLLVAAGLALTVFSRTARRLRDGDGTFAPAGLAAGVAALGLGTFDAVLHLAAVGAVGAVLWGAASPVDSPSPPLGRRALRWAALLAAIALTATTGDALARCVGLWCRTRPDAGFAGLARALAWNPADVRTRLELAEALLFEGDCARAKPHIEALIHQLPHHPSVRRMIAACPR